MKLKGIRAEDFTNYKKPSMFIAFPSCTFKCELECGQKMCQNSILAQTPSIEIDANKIIEKYLSNQITSAIVCGGLEPMDSLEDLIELIKCLRENNCEDDVVIYTGFYKNEIQDKIEQLSQYKNIIIKFGRFIPNQQSHYDEILGIELASDNQYAEVIS